MHMVGGGDSGELLGSYGRAGVSNGVEVRAVVVGGLAGGLTLCAGLSPNERTGAFRTYLGSMMRCELVIAARQLGNNNKSQ